MTGLEAPGADGRESRLTAKVLSKERDPERMAPRASPSFWHQSFPFTCGAAALASVLGHLGWQPTRPRIEEELELWRESTAIACPGTHPFALALAAERRGFRAEVFYAGARPWLWPHIRDRHGGVATEGYRMIEKDLERQCTDAEVPIHEGAPSGRSRAAGLLLTSAQEEAGADPDPHWVGLWTRDADSLVADPLREAPYRSPRSFEQWWDGSGFAETRCWISLSRRSGSTAAAEPRTPAAARPAPSDPSAPPPTGHGHHAHHHHGSGLERRAWSREEAIQALESPQRKATQDPAQLWSRIDLKPGEIVVDVGAGTGYFALEAARRVGPSGRVFAVDLSSELVELLRERRDSERLSQLEPIQNSLTKVPLESGIADVVLLANVLHDIPPSTVSEAVRLLKPNGRFLNVDWKKVDTPGGPPLSIRLTPEEAEKTLSRHGLHRVDQWEFGPWHYALLLERSRAPAPSPSRGTK